VPWYAKTFAALVVGYAFSSIDLIPDFIPLLGFLDDLVIGPLGLILAVKMIPEVVWDECQEEAACLNRTRSGESGHESGRDAHSAGAWHWWNMNYRDVTFYFYTGTGNSYRATSWMAGTVRHTGADVLVRSVESACPSGEIGMGETALLGLVMPTHGFTAPWAMLSFALRLPRRRDTHAVVVATRAGARVGSAYTPGFEGTATLLIALILALKGYRVRGTAGIDMPSNWIAVHPSLSADAVAEIVARAKRKTVRFMGTILSGRRSWTSWIVILLGLLVLPISLAYLLIGRFFLGKLFFASRRCNGCGLCAERCPNGAIEMKGSGRGRPYWTFRCQSCMRCMAYCPMEAVEASHLLGVGVYLLASAIPAGAFLAWGAARIPVLAILSWTPGWVVESVKAIIVIALLYPVFFLLLRIGWVNRFFTHATLTHYYRRYHEPETTLEDLG